MTDPSEAFLVGMEAAMRGESALPAAMGLAVARIYPGERPANAQLPYIWHGDDQVIGDDRGECGDASEIFSNVHIYAASEDAAGVKGGRRVRRIAGVLRPLLKDGFAIEGHTVSLAEFTDMRVLTDPAGSTHAVLTFRYRTTPAAIESEA